ncbi:hypothetical protein Patl1_07245 [Pistacia atlantica]|uniref:Uncharacterized protein n=1 Tax=Pistacia atlantica TaxID=434234 RepID=A0ACC1AG57_9ROSI|nr:hypothetical protein Patl1_07245 [Pistacia atlantica]
MAKPPRDCQALQFCHPLRLPILLPLQRFHQLPPHKPFRIPSLNSLHCDNNKHGGNMPLIIYFHGGGFAWMSSNSLGAEGNLAHHVAVKACEYEFQNLKVIGVIAIQPFLGGEERTGSEIMLVWALFIDVELANWFWRAYLPKGSDKDHPGANVFELKSEDIMRLKFPATLVIVGGFDPLQDWQRRYYNGLKKLGKEAYLIEYPNAFHAFYAIPMVLESRLCIKEIRDFMERQCAK